MEQNEKKQTNEEQKNDHVSAKDHAESHSVN